MVCNWWSCRFGNLKLLARRLIIDNIIVFKFFVYLKNILPLAFCGCTTWKIFFHYRWNKCWLTTITQFRFGMWGFFIGQSKYNPHSYQRTSFQSLHILGVNIEFFNWKSWIFPKNIGSLYKALAGLCQQKIRTKAK